MADQLFAGASIGQTSTCLGTVKRGCAPWGQSRSDWWQALLFFAYSSALGIFVLNVVVPTSTFMLVLLTLLTLGVAIDLAECTCALIVRKPLLPPRLEVMQGTPSVALLMTVCDDLVPEALAKLGDQTYANTTVFILDDSTKEENKRAVDQIGVNVLRRDCRRGAKAGNLNHWLRSYGKRYNYFVILDSDSILPPDFVQHILLYAEHPANQRLAIFNSLPECWNRDRRFPRLLSSATPLRNWVRLRSENLDLTTLSSGHNNLHRTSAVLLAGGFNEEIVAEDVALSLTLFDHGYRSVLTDVLASEAEPEHIFSFLGRQRRWAMQSLQAANRSWGPLPLSVRFRLFKLVWGYLAVSLYPVWFFVAAWSATSTWTDLKMLAGLLASERAWLSVGIERAFLPLLFPAAIGLVVVPLLRAAGVRARDFALYLILAWALTFYSMFELAGVCVRAIARDNLHFRVTDKRLRDVSLQEVVRYQPSLVVFLGIVAIGLSQNVVTLICGFPWFCLLLGCQLIVYWSHSRVR